ncbi:MAG TPA: hypothetical protein VD864_13825, partial [Nocardioides sp.]|nr:hypothetical protein [Nocardioides sp.]
MTTRLTWQAIALVLIVAAAAVALATFTRWSPSEITALVAVLAGVAGGYIVGGAAAGSVGDKVDAVHTETKQQTKVLETVERRTNGELDSRIAS